jgi:hypothetical protein
MGQGLMLLDAPVAEPYDADVWDLEVDPKTNITSFLGGLEAADEPPSFSGFSPQALTSPVLWDSVKAYFDRNNPDINLSNPTVLSLIHPLQQVVIAEWMSYAEFMVRCIKKYEYSIKGGDLRLDNDDSLEEDLRDLQRWRRRSMQTIGRLRILSRFVGYWHAKEGAGTSPTHGQPGQAGSAGLIHGQGGQAGVANVQGGQTGQVSTNTVVGQTSQSERCMLQQDIDHILLEIEEHSRHLEELVPTVTSFSQLLDSHRSVAEAKNVRQLTLAALIFVPLSFMASLFGMEGEYGPGGKNFRWYWASALPVAVVILVIARVEWKAEVEALVDWNKKRKEKAKKRKEDKQAQINAQKHKAQP